MARNAAQTLISNGNTWDPYAYSKLSTQQGLPSQTKKPKPQKTIMNVRKSARGMTAKRVF
jgi:hypothetical protein